MSPSPPKRTVGARQGGVRLAPADKLKRRIQASLTEDLLNEAQRTGHGRYDGFAYPAAEAYFHLGGGYAAGLQPMQLRHRGISHWWLLDKKGRVIDLTLGPGETSDFPYDRGRRRGFRFTPAGASQRARALIEHLRGRSPRRARAGGSRPGESARSRRARPPMHR
jgi:hypothetical protein